MKYLLLSLIGFFLADYATPARPAAAPPKLQPAFDVPVLLKKNIFQLEALLGKPYEAHNPNSADIIAGVSEWWMTFKHDTTLLTVTYNGSGEVLYFKVHTTHGLTKKVQTLYVLSNLTKEHPGLTVSEIPSPEHANLFTGIVIYDPHAVITPMGRMAPLQGLLIPSQR
ncbi:MAG: hypothetical protein ACRYFX_22095 [Janthinobacterium lividum]